MQNKILFNKRAREAHNRGASSKLDQASKVSPTSQVLLHSDAEQCSHSAEHVKSPISTTADGDLSPRSRGISEVSPAETEVKVTAAAAWIAKDGTATTPTYV